MNKNVVLKLTILCKEYALLFFFTFIYLGAGGLMLCYVYGGQNSQKSVLLLYFVSPRDQSKVVWLDNKCF